jgi:hypothetical protein
MTPPSNARLRPVALAAGMLLLAGGLAACTGPAKGAPGGGPPPAPAATSPAPDPTGTTPTPPAPTPTGAPVRAAGADCRPGDLDPRTIYGDGAAAGSHGQQVVVRNASATACRLATFPALRQQDGQPVPARPRDGGGQSAILLAPGGYAGFLVMTANGYGGYDPTSPACAHPRAYRDLSVVLAGGLRYPLRTFEVSLTCGEVSIGGWAPVRNPGTDVPNPTQLPG